MQEGSRDMNKRSTGLKRAYAVLVAGAMLVVGASVAYGAIPAADGTISACYDKQSGQMRIYDVATNLPKGCGPKEKAISWNVSGTPGQDGQDGQDGEDGADGVSGLETVTVESESNSDNVKALEAACPDGKVVVGGGAGVSGYLGFAPNSVRLTSTVPNATGTGWIGWADEFAPTDENWTLFASAICANAN